MRVMRLFLDQPLRSGVIVELDAAATHHVTRVLRLRAGDALTLFNGRGGEYAATLASSARAAGRVEVGAWRDIERESPLAITLAQGISGADRMDLTLQKAVELGAAAIQPLAAERSVVRLDLERERRRLAHWRRIVIAACEQCGRNRLPEVHEVRSVSAYCAQPAPGTQHLLLEPAADTALRDAARGISGALVLAAGPEAGFSEEEAGRFLASGYRPVHLGPRILRTETAALAALAALEALAAPPARASAG